MRQSALTLLAFIALTACGPVTPVTPAPKPPADQVAFMAAQDTTLAAWTGAPNDIIRKQIVDKRRASLCQPSANADVQDWLADVADISGDGGFVLDLGANVTFDGMAEKGSPIFSKLATMRVGQRVRFSGRLKGDILGECKIYISRLFDEAVVNKPSFGIELTNLQGAPPE